MKTPDQPSFCEQIIALAEIKCVQLDTKLLYNLEEKKILMNKEVAGIFLITPRSLTRWRLYRKLRHRKISNRYRYTWEDLVEYLKGLA